MGGWVKGDRHEDRWSHPSARRCSPVRVVVCWLRERARWNGVRINARSGDLSRLHCRPCHAGARNVAMVKASAVFPREELTAPRHTYGQKGALPIRRVLFFFLIFLESIFERETFSKAQEDHNGQDEKHYFKRQEIEN